MNGRRGSPVYIEPNMASHASVSSSFVSSPLCQVRRVR